MEVRNDAGPHGPSLCAAAGAVLILALAMSLGMGPGRAAAASTGELKLDVLGALGADAQNRAEVYAGNKQVAEVAPGHSVKLAPGSYRLVLPIVGGRIVKDGISIEAGHLHTVLIDDVAVLGVSVKNRDGSDPGYGVTVSASGAPHGKLAAFSSGETMLFAPSMVDVSVDAPPQGYNWNKVVLRPGHLTRLKLDEAVPGTLVVRPQRGGLALDNSTRVIVYQAGTQQRAAVSPPGSHRFKLDPGNYDVYVENDSGKGLPYAMLRGVTVKAGEVTDKPVSLEGGHPKNGN